MDNKYSFDLLNGAVTPAVIVEIIMSNSWDPKEKRMTTSKKGQYRFVLTIGQIRYTLCYLRSSEAKDRAQSTPLIVQEGTKLPDELSASICLTLCKTGLLLGRDESFFSVDVDGNGLVK